MKTLAANIEDVMREAAARWTLLAYFCLSTIFIIIFASAINLDVVDGALAGAKLFGKDVHMNESVNIEKLVMGAESVFSAILYVLCTFMAVFATAHLVPRMQEKGAVDLYLSRPVSRLSLLLSRYIAGLILAGSNVAYLMFSIWLIVLWKTHVAHPKFLLAGAIIMLVIASLLAFSFLVGVFTSSTAVSIMASIGVVLFSLMLVGHDRLAAAVSHEWAAWLIQGFYWLLPKCWELGVGVVQFVAGGAVPSELGVALTPAPFLTTAAFGLGSLILAAWLFQRKEF
jgi:ABC-2 type transport system permease protein